MFTKVDEWTDFLTQFFVMASGSDWELISLILVPQSILNLCSLAQTTNQIRQAIIPETTINELWWINKSFEKSIWVLSPKTIILDLGSIFFLVKNNHSYAQFLEVLGGDFPENSQSLKKLWYPGKWCAKSKEKIHGIKLDQIFFLLNSSIIVQLELSLWVFFTGD